MPTPICITDWNTPIDNGLTDSDRERGFTPNTTLIVIIFVYIIKYIFIFDLYVSDVYILL